jgi:pilus assembly protein CpaB
MTRRLPAIALALLLAVIGTGAVLIYVRRADARAIAGMKAVTVLVAQQRIVSGTPAAAALHAGWLRGEKLPASSVPAEAVRSLGPGLGSLVASADIQPGQVLLRSMLVAAVQANSGLPIPAGMVAVTIPLCLPQAVAGYVRAGSRVAVFDTYSGQGLSAQGSCGQAGGARPAQGNGTVYTRIVLPTVQVLSVAAAGSGGSAAGSGGSAAGSGGSAVGLGQSGTSSQAQGTVLVTLAVNQADAERVIQLAEVGLPYLALLTPVSHTRFDTGPYSLFRP